MKKAILLAGALAAVYFVSRAFGGVAANSVTDGNRANGIVADSGAGDADIGSDVTNNLAGNGTVDASSDGGGGVKNG